MAASTSGKASGFWSRARPKLTGGLLGLLAAFVGYPLYCLLVLIGLGTYVIEWKASETAIRYLWPSLDHNFVLVISAVGGAIATVLLVLGAGAIVDMISAATWKRRAARWQARWLRQSDWLNQVRKLNKTMPRYVLRDTYQDGIRLRDDIKNAPDYRHFARDYSALLADKQRIDDLTRIFDQERFNQALEALRRIVDEHP
jgi:hypothetical protein